MPQRSRSLYRTRSETRTYGKYRGKSTPRDEHVFTNTDAGIGTAVGIGVAVAAALQPGDKCYKEFMAINKCLEVDNDKCQALVDAFDACTKNKQSGKN